MPCAASCSEVWYSHLDGGTLFDIYNVDANKQRIAICNLESNRPQIKIGDDPDPVQMGHLGPRVRFMDRTENNAAVHTLFSKDMAQADEGTAWVWSWVGTSTEGENDFDWKISIENALNDDLFDIGYIRDNYGW